MNSTKGSNKDKKVSLMNSLRPDVKEVTSQ